jgi:hypothetical protein
MSTASRTCPHCGGDISPEQTPEAATQGKTIFRMSPVIKYADLGITAHDHKPVGRKKKNQPDYGRFIRT